MRLNAIMEVGTVSGAWTSDAIEDKVDQHRGLRKKGPFELIEEGDVVWAAYGATIEGGGGEKDKEFIKEDGIPIRIGSNVIIFEKALIGKPSVAKGVEFSSMFTQGPMAGKTVKFTIDVLKVKTKVKNDNAGSTAADAGGEQS